MDIVLIDVQPSCTHTMRRATFLLKICWYCHLLAISSFSIPQQSASDLGGDFCCKTVSIRDFEDDSVSSFYRSKKARCR